MKKVILVYDQNESIFQGMADHLLLMFRCNGIECEIIKGELLNQNTLQSLLSKLDDPFIFVAYSHGEVSGLKYNNLKYLKHPDSLPFFQKSFFYTYSCHFGKEFGHGMASQCDNSAFIGYEDVAYHNSDWVRQLYDMKTNSIKRFFIDGNTAKEVYDQLIQRYNELIGEYKHADPYKKRSCPLLVRNKTALILNGKEDYVFKENVDD